MCFERVVLGSPERWIPSTQSQGGTDQKDQCNCKAGYFVTGLHHLRGLQLLSLEPHLDSQLQALWQGWDGQLIPRLWLLFRSHLFYFWDGVSLCSPGLGSATWSSCFSLRCTGMTDMQHQAWASKSSVTAYIAWTSIDSNLHFLFKNKVGISILSWKFSVNSEDSIHLPNPCVRDWWGLVCETDGVWCQGVGIRGKWRHFCSAQSGKDHETLQLRFPLLRPEWWCMSLIRALGRQKQVDHSVEGQAGNKFLCFGDWLGILLDLFQLLLRINKYLSILLISLSLFPLLWLTTYQDQCDKRIYFGS